jgi:hypothetical protein
MYDSDVPSVNNSEFIKVVGVGTTVGSYITAQLTKYAVNLVASGITGVVIAFDNTSLQITYERGRGKTACNIAMKENTIAQFSLAMDRAQNSSYIRPELKQVLINEFNNDLKEILKQITDSFKIV